MIDQPQFTAYANFHSVNTPAVGNFKLAIVSHSVHRLLKMPTSSSEVASAGFSILLWLVELKQKLLGASDRQYFSFHDLKEAWRFGTNAKD